MGKVLGRQHARLQDNALIHHESTLQRRRLRPRGGSSPRSCGTRTWRPGGQRTGEVGPASPSLGQWSGTAGWRPQAGRGADSSCLVSVLCRQGSRQCWAVPQAASDRAAGHGGQAVNGGKLGEEIELITQVRGIHVRGAGGKVVCPRPWSPGLTTAVLPR